jgi:hypothetical protein
MRELSTARLDRHYSVLFLVSNRRNISPLHHQALKGRQILLTERPDLHLVWNYTCIFIKPLPMCLLSHWFWKAHVHSLGRSKDGAHDKSGLQLEAQGFVRTYASLVRHKSDFALAQQLGLLPQGLMDWPAWCHFIQGFEHLRDYQVSRRYHYGEIRLTRLNFWCRVLLRGTYFEMHHNYVLSLARVGAPYMLVFGAVAVILAALQTAVQLGPEQSPYARFAECFVPFSIALTVAGLVSIPALYMVFLAKELWLFVFRHRPLLV